MVDAVGFEPDSLNALPLSYAPEIMTLPLI
jgi:hypothetical protein